MALLEESARHLYREWFVRLSFPGHEHACIVDGVPEGWERAPLEDALILQRGFDLPEPRRDMMETCRSMVPPVFLVITTPPRRVPPALLQVEAVPWVRFKFVSEDYWPLNTALWVKEFKRVTPLFALFLLREMDLKQYNGGASVPTLDRKSVHQIVVLIPPSRLLRSFDEFAAEVFAQIKNLNAQNQKLRAARDCCCRA